MLRGGGPDAAVRIVNRRNRLAFAVFVAAAAASCGDDDGPEQDGAVPDGGADASADAAERSVVFVPNFSDDSVTEVDAERLSPGRKQPVAAGAGGVGAHQVWVDGERVLVFEATNRALAIMDRRTLAHLPGSPRAILPAETTELAIDLPRRTIYAITPGAAGALHGFTLDGFTAVPGTPVSVPGAQRLRLRGAEGLVYVFADRAVRVFMPRIAAEAAGSPYGLCCTTISSVVVDVGANRILLTDLEASSTLQRLYSYEADSLRFVDTGLAGGIVDMAADVRSARIVVVRVNNTVTVMDPLTFRTIPDISVAMTGEQVRYPVVDPGSGRLYLTQPSALRVLNLVTLQPLAGEPVTVGPGARVPAVFPGGT